MAPAPQLSTEEDRMSAKKYYMQLEHLLIGCSGLRTEFCINMSINAVHTFCAHSSGASNHNVVILQVLCGRLCLPPSTGWAMAYGNILEIAAQPQTI